MASKNIRIISGLNGTCLQTIPVADNTNFHEILMQCHEERKGKALATLLRGVQPLHPETTVREAGLEDGEEICLVWSKKTYFETPRLEKPEYRDDSLDEYQDLTGGLYIRIPKNVRHVEEFAFQRSIDVVEVLLHNHVTRICTGAFEGCRRLEEVMIPNSVKVLSWLHRLDACGDPRLGQAHW